MEIDFVTGKNDFFSEKIDFQSEIKILNLASRNFIPKSKEVYSLLFPIFHLAYCFAAVLWLSRGRFAAVWAEPNMPNFT